MKTAFFSSAIVLMMIICSCSDSSNSFEFFSSKDDYRTSLTRSQDTIIIDDTSWEGVLDILKEKGNDLIPGINISLSGYEVVCKISEKNLQDVKNTVKENITLIPCYDDANNIYDIQTNLNEVANSINISNVRYDFDRRNNYIEKETRPGMSLLKLHWRCNGNLVDSYCIVSDAFGIVYEDFIVNTMLFDSRTVERISKRLKSRDENPFFSGTKTWERSVTAYWLWGNERGRAEVAHNGYFSNGVVIGQDSQALAYISIGNAEAERTEIAYNKIAYGLGLSTPLIDITLSFNVDSYTLSFSASVGSKIGETGTHTHL
ncbi:MAG: hypothetical protein K6F98_06105 [Bacteroidales bacterium]|nr:hypothetical protein [Bacteroidales bacterium]